MPWINEASLRIIVKGLAHMRQRPTYKYTLLSSSSLHVIEASKLVAIEIIKS